MVISEKARPELSTAALIPVGVGWWVARDRSFHLYLTDYFNILLLINAE